MPQKFVSANQNVEKPRLCFFIMIQTVTPTKIIIISALTEKDKKLNISIAQKPSSFGYPLFSTLN